MLLDEPTASLDAVAEASLDTNLFADFADACVISSVHRLNLLPRFDEVIVHEDGRIVAHGPPAIVAADGGGTGIASDAPREVSAAY